MERNQVENGCGGNFFLSTALMLLEFSVESSWEYRVFVWFCFVLPLCSHFGRFQKLFSLWIIIERTLSAPYIYTLRTICFCVCMVRVQHHVSIWASYMHKNEKIEQNSWNIRMSEREQESMNKNKRYNFKWQTKFACNRIYLNVCSTFDTRTITCAAFAPSPSLSLSVSLHLSVIHSF